MGITVGNTSITFNDATTQSTAFAGIGDSSITDAKISEGMIAAATYYPIDLLKINAGATTSYILARSAYIYRGGTFNFQVRLDNGNNGSFTNASLFGRIYRNGVAVSPEVGTGNLGYNSGTTITFTNLALARGGTVQLYVRASDSDLSIGTSNWTYGVSNPIKIPAIVPV